MENKDYYKIPISMFWFWVWLIIITIFILISMGTLIFLIIIPIIIFCRLKKTEYLYNNQELIIKRGIIFKTRRSIAINKIEEINYKLGLLNLIIKAKPISLMNIKNVSEEAEKFIENWNKSR